MLADGEAALAQGDWAAARVAFEAAVDAEETAAAWEGLSWAMWWLSDADATIAARERAYRLYKEAGDAGGAARTAAWLASDFLDFRGEDAVAVGWLQRARRALDGQPPSPDLGWVEVIEGDAALNLASDPETAIAQARRAAQLGREFGVPYLEALGLGL